MHIKQLAATIFSARGLFKWIVK